MVFLEIDDLSTSYSTSKGFIHAVDDVSFSLEDGESIGIAGESACGKSTLGLSLIRMIPESATMTGKIVIDGKTILTVSENDFSKNFRWKKIAMVFQGAMNSLDPVFTINQQFIEVLKQHHYDGDFEKAITNSIQSVGLNPEILQKYPHELSGGMKQRVVIAMALLLNPKFVIADEPTTALDVLIQAQIIHLLKDLKKKGMSIMLITHDLAILSEIADKIGIMYAGQIVEFGSLSEVYSNPKHPYTKGLLASIPKLRGDKPQYVKGTPPSLLEPSSECRFIPRCPFAMDVCKKDPPNFKTDTGYVKCWLYDDKK